MVKVLREIYNDGNYVHIYHDAHSQITDGEARKYMADNEYDLLIIHSILECNSGTVYDGRQIGNCPELNPLDCYLFADLLAALSFHMCITSS